MKRMILIITLIFAASLLICSQSLAAGAQVEPQVLNEGQISEMQRLLTEQGYQGFSVDGILSEETMAAIRQFQESEGLTVTGTPNAETLRSLAPDSTQQEFFGLSPEYGESQQ